MKRYYIYLIPYRDAAGEKFYCGYSDNPARREKEHDKTRFSHKCTTCFNGLITLDASWGTLKCPACDGTKRVLNTTSGRVKTGRMHVVGIVDRGGSRHRWNVLVSGMFFGGVLQLENGVKTVRDAMSAERFMKRQRVSIKKLAYEYGVVPEELRAS